MTRTNFAWIFMTLGATAIGCGGLGDADDAPPLAVVEGRLSQASTSAPSQPSNVRVAVVWNTSASDFRTTYDIEVTPVFPSKFRLELKDVPPRDAMSSDDARKPSDPTSDQEAPAVRIGTQDTPSTAKYAIGSIVAYEDTNANGRLDLLKADEAPIDRVLGINQELLLVYIEGDPSSVSFLGETGTPTKGFNLLRASSCEIRKGDVPAPCDPTSWLPISTLYELPLTADPQFAEAMCRSNSSQSDVSPTTSNVKPGDPLPPAPGADGWPAKDALGLKCAADGKSYSYATCTSTSLGLCKGTHETCSDNSYGLPSTPPPAEWPCTVK